MIAPCVSIGFTGYVRGWDRFTPSMLPLYPRSSIRMRVMHQLHVPYPKHSRLVWTPICSAGVSGGALYHTGVVTLQNVSFVANRAGDEGMAVTSIGELDKTSNASFTGNTIHCPVGEYSIEKNADGEVRCFSGDGRVCRGIY